MGWTYLAILFAVCLFVCLVGYIKYVYFLSLGYGLSVAAIGVALLVMSLCGLSASIPQYILCVILIVYGFRLSGFLLIRELKNASYRTTLKEATATEKPMPIFVKVTIWLVVAVLYVCQTAPVFYAMYNGGASTICSWIGIVICVLAIILEAESDREKSAQKKVRPDMVATKGLYKIVRCPNYLGEILFWTGLLVSCVDILTGWGQWVLVIVAYVCIVYIMINGAQRLERRQMARYGNDEEYNKYANSTPIIFPIIPLYHLNKKSEK